MKSVTALRMWSYRTTPAVPLLRGLSATSTVAAKGRTDACQQGPPDASGVEHGDTHCVGAASSFAGDAADDETWRQPCHLQQQQAIVVVAASGHVLHGILLNLCGASRCHHHRL